MTGPQRSGAVAGRSAGVVDARRLDGPGDGLLGEFFYTVVPEKPRPLAAAGDKRGLQRQRTRLRSGKIADPEGRFLTECLIFDRSEAGSRLRLPAGIVLPRWIQFYDDQSAVLYHADVMWRRERDIGVRFRPFVSNARTRALAADMRRRYYAVPN